MVAVASHGGDRSEAVTCRSDGVIVDRTALAGRLLQDVDGLMTTPTPRVTPALWQAVSSLPIGEALDWWPADVRSGLRVTRFALDAGASIVYLHPLADRSETESYRLYRAMRHVVAQTIAGAAHDLRSPLASMTFTLGVLRRRWGELPDAERQAMLAELAASCELQLASVDELVDVVSQVDVAEVALAPLLQRLGERLRPLYRVRKNRLLLEVDAALVVRGAAMTLEHVFVNLLTNAVQSSSSPVQVRVRVATLDGAIVKILVEDDGPGVASALRPRVFEPRTSTKHDGSGMGLSLAREAARQLGGDLRLVDSERGACFEVALLRAGQGGVRA
jgi:signal transduction histidine kinase